MPTKRKPRCGSLQVWPRKRAKSQTPRVRAWANVNETKLLGFPGYKVGMSHVIIADKKATSMTKGQDVSFPVTIVECPAIKTASIVLYKNSQNRQKVVSSVFASKTDKELGRIIPAAKKPKKKLEDIKPEDFDDLKVLVYTQPRLTTIGKKKPELFEIAIGGKKDAKLAWAKENLGKEISVQDIFKAGQFLDVHGITKGKGFQGAVKRFGISLKPHKSQKSRRKSVLAAEGAAKVDYTAHQPGQMGYHQRMQHNLMLIDIKKPEEVNREGGFHRYGNAKNACLLVKGSVQGPAKRMVVLTDAIRPAKNIKIEAPDVQYIATK